MIIRKFKIQGGEGFVSYTRKGTIYLPPPVPPKFKPMVNVKLLFYAEINNQPAITGCSSNWLRWLIYRLMPPSPRRRRILENI